MQYLNEGNARAMGITAVKFCRRCGAAIPPDSPQHSCGACLLETGLSLLTDEPVAGDDLSAVALAKADDPGRVIADVDGLRRLRIARANWPRRTGRSVSSPSKESQSHSRVKGHQPWSVGEQSAPEALSS